MNEVRGGLKKLVTGNSKAVLLLVAIALLLGGWSAWVLLHRIPEGLVQVNGRIEGDEVAIAGKQPGKILQMTVAEGASVKKGDLLVRFESQQALAKLEEAKASLEKAAAAEEQAARDARRYGRLAREGAIDRHKGEEASIEMRVAAANQAQASATVVEAQSVVNDLTVNSPTDGTVTTKVREEGEVVPAGAPLYTIVNLDRLYLKVYVPEVDIGKVRLGLPARIYTDAFPGQAFEATVTSIAPRAEFTPKEVQTQDERVKLVYAVKLSLTSNPEHELSPGLPADAMIRWKDDVSWRRPKW
ncbi:MAG: efflux RND transporter periplasmic adaptor subunit [Oligoflexia bacterium]|nr:efflux RND transporter periplasmic adaptor subunit [Oligoflexia bacterium]